MLDLRRLPPTAEVELLARAIAADRYARVVEAERPPIPIPAAVVRAIIRANRRLRDLAARN
jgi:hypothetical protein